MDDRNPLDDWILEGAGAGGHGATGNYSGYGTAYYNYRVYSYTASYDAWYRSQYIPSGYTGQISNGNGDVNNNKATSSSVSSDTFLPEKYYTENKASNYGTPYTSSKTIKYNSWTGEYEETTTYYDYAGRKMFRIDWTNHGYPNHGNPHVHVTIYSKQFPEGYTERWD